MNANELAKLLEVDSWYKLVTREEIATMLRQQQAEIKKWTDQYQRLNENLEMWKAGHFKQQAEIEALKAEKIRAYNNGVEDGRKPDTNNEPVAWMNKIATSWVTTIPDEFKDEWIPLYTHPVKELTDEEIIEIGLLTTDPRFSHIE